MFQATKYIKRAINFNGYRYKTPFLDPIWLCFTLRLPHKYRRNCFIYKKIVNRAFPEFFNFPTTNKLGGSLNISFTQFQLRRKLFQLKNIVWKKYNTFSRHLDPFWAGINLYRKLNYIDFDEAIRTRGLQATSLQKSKGFREQKDN